MFGLSAAKETGAGAHATAATIPTTTRLTGICDLDDRRVPLVWLNERRDVPSVRSRPYRYVARAGQHGRHCCAGSAAALFRPP